VAAGRVDAALAASAELDGLADSVGTTAARAAAAHAGGENACAGGDLELARRRLEDAVDLLGLCEAPYERARSRLLLARILFELGQPKRARAEAGAARGAVLGLDSRRAVATTARLLHGA